MTYLTFKSYVRKKFKNYTKTYYKGQYMYINNVLKLARDNDRLAYLGQAYFTTNKKLSDGNKFSVLTGKSYKTIKDFENDNGKYQNQYRDLLENRKIAKKEAIKKINSMLIKKNKSISWLASQSNIDRSNLYKVLKKEQYKNVSLINLLTLNNILNRI